MYFGLKLPPLIPQSKRQGDNAPGRLKLKTYWGPAWIEQVFGVINRPRVAVTLKARIIFKDR